MPQTGSGIYEVVLFQRYFNVVCLNVFHFLSNINEDDNQSQCAFAFQNTQLPQIALTQLTQVAYEEIVCRNLTGSLADITLVPSTPSGLVVGTPMNQFVSMPYRYNRIQKDTRDGAKRFVGVAEENAEKQFFEAVFFGLMQTLATFLDNGIADAGKTFNPIILRKPDLGLGIFQYSQVSSVTALNRQTTQSSRKDF